MCVCVYIYMAWKAPGNGIELPMIIQREGNEVAMAEGTEVE